MIIFQNVELRNMEFLEKFLLSKEFAVSLLVSGNDLNALVASGKGSISGHWQRPHSTYGRWTCFPVDLDVLIQSWLLQCVAEGLNKALLM